MQHLGQLRRDLITSALIVLAVGIALAVAGSAGAASAGKNGKILFLSNRSGDRELYAVNRDGTDVRRLTFNNLFERAPRWSPAGTQIAFAGRAPDGNWDVYTVRADGTDLQRLTTDPARDDEPAWTSDGTRLVYDHGLFACPCELRIMKADGTGSRTLETGPGNAFSPDLAPTNDRVAFSSDRSGRYLIYTMALNGTGLRQLTTATVGFSDFAARWSPDGTELAFLRDSTGLDNDLYVVGSNGQRLRRLTDTPSRLEFNPAWAPDQSEIVFFASSDGPSHLFAIRPGGGGDVQLSTSYKAPLVDDFSDNTRDAGIWHQIVTGTETSIAETKGEVDVSIGPGAVAGGPYNVIDAHYGFNCGLAGDFDVQVDYTLLQWPSANGVQAALSAFFANTSVGRESQTWGEQYFAWLDGFGGTATTSDLSGSLRLVRSGATMTAYWFLPGAGWVPIRSAPANANEVTAGFGAGSDDTRFAHQSVAVAFDNFRLNSGPTSCPTWWEDSWPDWQALQRGHLR